MIAARRRGLRQGVALAILGLGLMAGCKPGYWTAEVPRNRLLAEEAACHKAGGAFRRGTDGGFACVPAATTGG